MPRRLVLNTSVLIRCWNAHPGRTPLSQLTERQTRGWARDLAKTYDTHSILTPIEGEMLAGTQSAEELRLTTALIGEFKSIDEGRILHQDWAEALRLAKRVPRNRAPRQLVDCLIRAIANRLGYDAESHDAWFPR
jgi:hypothetical protein